MRPDAMCEKRDMKGRRAAVDGDRVLRADVGGEGLLEGEDAWALDKLARAQCVEDRSFFVFFNDGLSKFYVSHS
jgi:hypothetical protein